MRFLKLFTEIPDADLAELEKLEGAQLNEAKVLLADEATRMLHGEEQLQKAKSAVANVFAGHGAASAEALPQITVTPSQIAAGMPVVDLFAALKLCDSKTKARKLVKGNGARLNGEKITDERLNVQLEQFVDGEMRLSVGKKKHGIVVLGE